MGLGLVGAATSGSVYNTLDQILAQRMAQQQYADKLKQQDVENQQRQQQIDITKQNAQAQQARWKVEDARAAQTQTQAQGNQLVDELSPGQSISENAGRILTASGRGDLQTQNPDYAYPGFLQSGPDVRDVNPGQQAGRVFTGTAAQQFQRSQAETTAERQRQTDARADAQFNELMRHDRATEANAANNGERLVQIEGPNRTPIWVHESQAVNKPAANAPRAPTGQDRTALGFFNRMLEAEKNARRVEDTQGGWDLGAQQYAPGWMENWLQSKEGQAYTQAQRMYTEARLRKESGAAIPQSEFDTDRKTNFRIAGDNPDLVKQKRQSRLTTMRGLGNASGRAFQEYYGEGVTLDDLLKEFADQPPAGGASGFRVVGSRPATQR